MTSSGSSLGDVWAEVMSEVVHRSHLVVGDGLPVMLADAVRPLGLDAEILLVDLAQQVLTPAGPPPAEPESVEGTPAGQAFQHGGQVDGVDERGLRVLWVAVLNGTERVGVLRLTLGPDVVDDATFRRRAATLAGLMGHVVMSKLVYSDHLRQLRCPRGLSIASELLWQLVPPRTFATENVVVAALLEPYDRVAGDAYDYAVHGDTVYLGVFDGVGHDLAAGITTALAVNAIRNARRHGHVDLVALANSADDHLARYSGPTRFVTAVLARLDTTTGKLDYLIAGHPPPLLVRGERIVRQLEAPPRHPLGVVPTGVSHPTHERALGHEQLEPGDRLLFYTDGIVEARKDDGAFFGERRLIDLTERIARSQVSAPETLRRLTAAVLDHQDGKLQDDATLLMLDWTTSTRDTVLPSDH